MEALEGHHYGEQNIGREHGEDSMPVQVEAEEDELKAYQVLEEVSLVIRGVCVAKL